MFKPGLRVTHPLFGTGTVRAVTGSGDQAKITVDFAPSVGQKKLLAGVANLKIVDSDGSHSRSSSQPSPAIHHAWFETLDATYRLRSGQRVASDDDMDRRVREDAARPDFWALVRERARAAGRAPRVLDDLSGKVSITISGRLQLRIVVQHDELLRQADAFLAEAIAQTLAQRQLQEYERAAGTVAVTTEAELDDSNLLVFGSADIGELPDRAPLRRPIREAPKGQIRSRPRRRDDY
jgi:hypothetical protein